MKAAPEAALSGLPERGHSAKTAVRSQKPRRALFSCRRSSIAKRAQGKRELTAGIGESSQGVIVIEKEKATAPNKEASRERRSSRNQSHVPERERRSLSAAANVKDSTSGRAEARIVRGKNAADWPLAARGVPQPSQRFRGGRPVGFEAESVSSATPRSQRPPRPRRNREARAVKSSPRDRGPCPMEKPATFLFFCGGGEALRRWRG